MTSGHRFIYLAYPIDQTNPAQMHQIADEVDNVQHDLAELGVGTYNPGAAFKVGAGMPVGPEIAQVNGHALSRCTGVLAFLPLGVPTIGVPMEVERAVTNLGKPTAIVGAGGWALGISREWVRQFGKDEVAEAVGWLLDQQPIERNRLGPQPLPFAGTGTLPTRAHSDDAGLDLYASSDVTVGPGEFADVPVELAVELPSDCWGMITGRSSTLRRRGLMVAQGVIDPGYRGPLFSGVWNLGSEPVRVRVGERLAQLILIHNATARVEPVMVSALAGSERGTNGFGSSGT